MPLVPRSLLLALSGIFPVLLLQLLSGAPIEATFLLLCVAVCITCFWHVLLPHNAWTDCALLLVLTAFVLLPWFKPLYPTTESGLKLNALSKLLWLRLGINSFLYIRRFPVPRVGFIPNRKEWMVGVLNFFLFLGVLVPAGLAMGFLKFQLPRLETWQLPFLAFAWFWALLLFLAFGEEFLVRGILQQVLARAWGGRVWPLLVTSLCFGAIHLSFRNQFPNWRFAAVSALAGIFYGLAFWQGKSLRAAMVTHALTVTAWNVFFARSI
jgi:membrane protease YdiL (CAAX protease family)